MTGTAVATIQEKARNLAAYFDDKKDKFASFMTADTIDRFMRVMNNAILKDPQIAEASPTSVFLECQKAASDGLVLDGREAVLTRFKSNKKVQKDGKWVDNWQTEVVYIPMIKGLRKLAHQSPQIASWTTGLVYEREYLNGLLDKDDPHRRIGYFEYHAGDAPHLEHKPMIVGEPGPVVAAYSVVRMRNGQLSIDVMTIGKLNAIKSRTKSRKFSKDGPGEITGPWATDEAEMQIKTVARHHFKSLPLEGKIETAAHRVDGLYDFDGDVTEVEPEPERPMPKAVANKKNGSAAAKLAAARQPAETPQQQEDAPDETGDETGHDPETGEVLDGEIVPGDEF